MKCVSCIVGILAAISISGCSAEPDVLDPAMIEAFETLRQEHAIPGMTVALYSSDRTIATGALGYADARGEPSEIAHAYNWFSITKLATATAIMLLVERGQLDLDQPYGHYVPDFKSAHDCAKAPTIRHLLSHSSGVTEDLTQVGKLGLAGESIDSLATMAKTQFQRPLATCPGESIDYANMNFLLLGYLVEVISGAQYTQFVKRELLDPAEIEAGFDGTTAKASLATGHLLKDDVYLTLLKIALNERYEQIFAFEDSEYHYLEPYRVSGSSYGGLVGSARALASFGRALVGNSSPLSAQSIATMQQQQSFDAEAAPNHRAYGLGWRLSLQSELGLVMHDGAGPGYASLLVYSPEHDLGLALLANLTVDKPLSQEPSPTIELTRIFHRHYLAP